jgi:hypothetical protein
MSQPAHFLVHVRSCDQIRAWHHGHVDRTAGPRVLHPDAVDELFRDDASGGTRACLLLRSGSLLCVEESFADLQRLLLGAPAPQEAPAAEGAAEPSWAVIYKAAAQAYPTVFSGPHAEAHARQTALGSRGRLFVEVPRVEF